MNTETMQAILQILGDVQTLTRSSGPPLRIVQARTVTEIAQAASSSAANTHRWTPWAIRFSWKPCRWRTPASRKSRFRCPYDSLRREPLYSLRRYSL